MPKSLITLSLAIGLLVVACNENKNPVQPEPSYTVSGTLDIWRCGVGDWFNNQGEDHRFGVVTGRTAVLRFISSEGAESVCLTDDSSTFRIALDTGSYSLVIETDYTWPDTVPDLHVGTDTALALNIVYAWFEPASLRVVFYYSNPADSLGEFRERAFLQFFEDRMEGMVVVDSASRTVRTYPPDPAIFAYVTYAVPVAAEHTKWQVVIRAQAVFLEYETFFPGGFYVDPGYYICMNR